MGRSFARTALIIYVLLASRGIPVFGEFIDPFVMPSARSGALGGTHAAFGDDFYILFTNPAALFDAEEEFSAAEITLNMYGPVFELIDILTDRPDNTIDISGIVGPRGFASGFDMGGPLALGWIGRRLGVGVFNRTRVEGVVTGTVIRPIISEEILFLGGYSFRFLEKQSHVLDAGFIGKGFYRGTINMESSVFNVTNMGVPADNPFTTNLGMGFDLGLRYTFAGSFSAALVCYDAYSPAMVTTHGSFSQWGDDSDPAKSGSYATVKPRLDVGVAYKVRSGFLERYISNFVVMADYQDFLDMISLIPRNPILNVGIGAELVVLNVLSLRAGIADALPALGFGLNLKFITLDFAIHGKELGLDPGVQSVYEIDIGLLFRY
ncbi:MAG: hypothetical protein LBP32_03210 [Spirochaetaceae bacterium]|jgi:hypothetical protein|nr:hypothetical protein [Spirochaetaceae bacterium]